MFKCMYVCIYTGWMLLWFTAKGEKLLPFQELKKRGRKGEKFHKEAGWKESKYVHCNTGDWGPVEIVFFV